MPQTHTNIRKLTPVPWKQVKLEGGFWGKCQETNRKVTLPIEYEQCRTTGRIDAWKLAWKPGDPDRPHHFWDSDIGKWIEAAAYSLATHPDAELEKKVDEVIDSIEKAQHADGYLNIFYSVVEPGKRFTNLRDMHELYCAGHLTEAAVAYYEATGKRKLLDVLCRYMDCIGRFFGPEEGKIRGYDGHEEVELALVKLYRATGNEKYLALGRFFIDERGKQPHFFDLEAQRRGEDTSRNGRVHDNQGAYCYFQAHIPVRRQKEAIGHAVRAMYLYSGMADIAAETGDRELLEACRNLWEDTTQKQMYIIGSVGSKEEGERFTYAYDLPNETAYAETCAAIGLVFWAHRMLQLEGDAKYADVMERALYNGVLSGISLEGDRFFYANPLAVHPPAYRKANHVKDHITDERQAWFGCACCPPNIARLISSLGGYVYSAGENEVFAHLYVQGAAELEVRGWKLTLRQKSNYPWDGRIRFEITPAEETEFVLQLRIPGWCRKYAVAVNDEPVSLPAAEKGYAGIRRLWKAGDTVTLALDMPVERIEANPAVRMDCGRIALQRGPVVYCLEETDNGKALQDIAIPADSVLAARYDPHLLGGVAVLEGRAKRRDPSKWRPGELYRPVEDSCADTDIRAVPYYAWCNRTPGEMVVWLGQI